jgi:hypothetical protein
MVFERGAPRKRTKEHLRKHPRQIPEPDVRISGRRCADGHKPCYVLRRDYEYVDSVTFDVPVKIRVKRGFHYDGASVPRWVRWLIDAMDLSVTAPLLHDVIYRFCGVLRHALVSITPFRTYTREQGDALFRRVMDQEGVSEWKEWAGHKGVRIGGWNAWRKNARRIVGGGPWTD